MHLCMYNYLNANFLISFRNKVAYLVKIINDIYNQMQKLSIFKYIKQE